MVFDVGKQRDGSLHIVQPDPCGFGGLRRGEEFERGAGDDAERAFAADEQVFEFVAGGVFVQRVQVGDEFAVGQHHFQPQHQIAHGAVAQHVQAAGVAGDVAADLAAAFAGEAEREKAAVFGGGGLDVLQNAACIDGDGVVGKADMADSVEFAQIQDDAAVRHAAANQSGVTALRCDGDAVLRAETDGFLHVFHAGRLHDDTVGAGVAFALVKQEGRVVVGQFGG